MIYMSTYAASNFETGSYNFAASKSPNVIHLESQNLNYNL